ncbi:MAG: DUF551 domain-containing protein [Methylococcaceae bacterium]
MPKIYDYQDIQKLPKKWIDVNDALPPIGVEVIVFCPYKKENGRNPVTALCRLIRYEGDHTFYWDNNYGSNNTHVQNAVTMWQPMPDEPAA